MTEENFKSFYANGNCKCTGMSSLWNGHNHHPWHLDPFEDKISKGDTIYKAVFSYEMFCSKTSLEAKRTADRADWMSYINECEEKKKQVNQSSSSGIQKEQERKAIDQIVPNLDQG